MMFTKRSSNYKGTESTKRSSCILHEISSFFLPSTQTASANDNDKSSAFPDFLFMKRPSAVAAAPEAEKKKSSKKKKKSKKSMSKSTSSSEKEEPKRNSFLTVLEKLLRSDKGQELIEKHAKVSVKNSSKTKNSSKAKSKKQSRGHPKTIVTRPSAEDQRRISDLSSSQPFDWQKHSLNTAATNRLSVSEQSITFNMDESKSDYFDWKEYSQSRIGSASGRNSADHARRRYR